MRHNALMDNWSRIPFEVPFVPRSKTMTFLTLKDFWRRRRLTRLFQTALVLVLAVTITLNINFIIETCDKLQRKASATDLAVEKIGRRALPRNIKEAQELSRNIGIEVLSSKDKASISVDGTTIFDNESSRGLYVVVLNQATGAVMARKRFDTYLPHEDDALILFLNMIRDGRLLIFAIRDEATFNMKARARKLFTSFGSSFAKQLRWRDTWAFVTVKNEKRLAEKYSAAADVKAWGLPVLLRTSFTLRPLVEAQCVWSETEENQRRLEFCNKYEGYGSVCNCKNPAPVDVIAEKILDNKLYDVPVIVVASNRPQYLYRMLGSLLSAAGAQRKMILVFIDGYFQEPLDVAKLFGVRAIQHSPLGVKNARISQHFKSSLTATFNLFPVAKYAIVLEEDLDVSPDFYSFFSQSVHLFTEDDSVYCVSAWNDLGYEHTVGDPSLLYRVEGMPGLGWMMRRSTYKEELELKWPGPEKLWDWDIWMRLPSVRGSRECIVPDVSRTFHFGSKGVNMNSYFQETYFKKHAFNTAPNVRLKDVDSLKKNNYEDLMHSLVKSSTIFNHQSPCNIDSLSESNHENTRYVLYISMKHSKDHDTWKQLAKCWRIWDLDVRGIHRGSWRLFLNRHPITVVGSPYSPYAKYMPLGLTPVSFAADH